MTEQEIADMAEYMKALEWRLEAMEPLLTELVDNAKSTGRCHYCQAFGVSAIVHNPRCPITRGQTLLRGEV